VSQQPPSALRGWPVCADESLRRLAPQVWLGGSPLRLFRLTEPGDELLRELEAAGPGGLAVNGSAATRLIDRLVTTGAANPLPVQGDTTPDPAEVTLVVPVRDRARSLDRLLERWRSASPGPPRAAVVVDDGSVESGEVAAVAGRHAATLLVNETPRGPAAARNAGLRQVRTPLVAFVDSDVRADGDWLAPLLAQMADPRVALVAPRVRSRPGPGALARYEFEHSPLDLGAEPSVVRPRARVAYLPAATLVGRVSVLRDLGGFDESMRFGEDVDLVWRVVDAGHGARYEPASQVFHAPRADWLGWARQRFAYGSSAAPLHTRHPGSVAPVSCSGWSAAMWALAGAGHPVAALAVGAGSGAALARKLEGVAPTDSAMLAVKGHAGAARGLSRAVVRPWWPVALAASAVSRRARRFVLASVATTVAAAEGTVADRFTSLADDAVYGAGVWWGAARERSFGALLPALPRWP